MGTLVDLSSARADSTATDTAPVVGRTLVRAPELGELRGFCAAVDLHSIGSAARLLHVSQPALSKRLHGLEALTGTPLLNRSTRGVTPTPAGAALYDAARRLLDQAAAVEELMRGFAGIAGIADPVRVAASPTVADWWLPEVLVDFESRHEHHLSAEVITANSTIVRTMVRDRRIDVGLAAVDGVLAEDALNETVIWEDELIVAVPFGHRWAMVQEIDPEDFSRTPIVHRDPGANSSRVVQAALSRAGLTAAPPLAEIGSTAAAKTTALTENAPVLLPLAAMRDERDGSFLIRRVAGIRFERQFSLILAGGLQDLSPSARAFVQHLLSWAAEHFEDTEELLIARAAGGEHRPRRGRRAVTRRPRN